MMSSGRGSESFFIMIMIIVHSFKSLGGKESFEIELPEFGLYFSFAAALLSFFFGRPVDKAGSKIFFSNFEPILKPFTMSQLENDVVFYKAPPIGRGTGSVGISTFLSWRYLWSMMALSSLVTFNLCFLTCSSQFSVKAKPQTVGV